MKRTRWIRPWVAFAAVSLIPANVEAQAEKPRTQEPANEAVEQKPAASLPGPKLLNLRYDEDFSYLDGESGSYRGDLFDPIKNIRLSEDWRLSLGGEFRVRLEAETNKAFGATEPAQDTFTLFRYMLHTDLKYRDLFRVFVQGVGAFDEDRDLAPRGQA